MVAQTQPEALHWTQSSWWNTPLTTVVPRQIPHTIRGFASRRNAGPWLFFISPPAL
ncbi:hypothetical protein EMIT0P171_40270 [Pseudomonas sp. IT-P171]